MAKEASDRINGLDFLRGVASFSVCWFHLTSFTYASPDGWFYAPLRRTGTYGWLGVEVFFVISGFVIPYSLHRAGYGLGSYPNFIAKRLVRLDPPYLASILIVLALAVAYGLFKGHAPLVEGKPVDAARVLLHLGYANIFFHYDWLNPSYWTLAIELQYYLLVGLAYPLFVARGRWTRLLAFACFGAASLTAERALSDGVPLYNNFILRFVPLFLLGAATFQRRARIAGRAEYVVMVTAAACLCLVTVGSHSTAAALLAVGVINFYERRTAVTDFLGKISYSLYLLHWPVGHLVLSLLGLKLLDAQSDAARVAVIFVSLAVCIAAAYALYLTVELPSQRWASRFSYGRVRAAVATSGLAGADSQPPRRTGTPRRVLSGPRRAKSYTGAADSSARRARHHLRLSRLRTRAVHPSRG
ncbi:MAG TPA: acyltransferase [Pyrinomonadaceae bacterium]|nr:acyltransferase [Pyrinomonadaceae bacterium]